MSILAACALATLLPVYFTFGQTAIVDWRDVHQTMDGFGASCADFFEGFTSQMADFFFTTSGIGLSLLRVQVVPSADDCRSYFGSGGGNCLPVSSGATILDGEVAIAKQAVARGVTVWAAPWSPPATMKSNGSFANGGYLLPEHYSDWAATLAGYVQLLHSQGIPLYAVSVQNEPDIIQDYGSCIYTPRELHDFVPLLHAALASAGAGSTKVMIAEASTWDFSLTALAMRDPSVSQAVGILAAHGYNSTKTYAPVNYGKPVWQTEDSSQSSEFDGSIADGVFWALKIHRYLTVANVNAWHWWFLSDGPKHGDGTDNAALTDFQLRYPKRAFVLGQWSRFVRPGWQRITASSIASPLAISAFKDPSGRSFAIIAVNSSKWPVSQTFSLRGFSAGTITPWITSAQQSLSSLAAVHPAGSSFSYEVPAQSVVTFAGSVVQAP